jgi:hypothetical protein
LSPHISHSGDFDEFNLVAGISAPDAQILLQYFGTDIALTSSDGLTIFQCKATDSERTFTLSVLKQCLVDGSKQLSRMRAAGDAQPIRDFVIAANMLLSPEISGLEADLDLLGRDSDPKVALAPTCLGGQHGNTIADWCAELADADREGKPKLSPDLAELASKLLLKLRYTALSRDRSIAAFELSMRKLGLKGVDIHQLADSLSGALVRAHEHGQNIAQALCSHLKPTGELHSLCTHDLGVVAGKRFDDLRSNSGVEPPDSSLSSDQLPRTEVWDELIGQMEETTRDPSVRVLSLIGDGGMGKTKMVFDLPTRIAKPSDFGQEVVLLPAGTTGSYSYLYDALEPLFRGLSYVSISTDRDMLERLLAALDACGENPALWILIPNSDQLEGAEFKKLLEDIQAGPERVKYVLTARSLNWPKDTQWDNESCRTIYVPAMSKNEIYAWFAGKGANQRSMNSRPLLGSGIQTHVPVRSAGDAVHAGFFDHPLSFDALRKWNRSKNNDSFQLQSLLDMNGGQVIDFMNFARDSYCDRVRKHLSVQEADIRVMFEKLFDGKSTLSSHSPGEVARTYGDHFADPSQAVAVLMQFLQIGVLRQSDDQNRTISWAVPFEPGGPGK